MAKTEIAKTQTTEIAVVKVGALAALPFMDMEDFGGGFEGTDSSSYAIPFLQLLQKMSPLVDEDHAKYIPGAKAGMFYNTVTQKLYDGKAGFHIIQCAYKRSFIQWGGRDGDAPGFKGEFAPEQIAELQAKGEIVTLEGKLFKPDADGVINEKKNDRYEDTRSHYVIVIDAETGEYGQAILSLSASLTKASKMLMTTLQQKKVDTPRGKQTPPTFANMVKLSTVAMSNDKGSWSGVRFDLDGLVTDPLIYADAKAFYKAIVAGEIKADYSKAEADAGAGAEVGQTAETAEGF